MNYLSAAMRTRLSSAGRVLEERQDAAANDFSIFSRDGETAASLTDRFFPTR
jgi:hypothetical protein